VLTLILLPFILWEERISAISLGLLDQAPHRAGLAGLSVSLLAADVLLPIPSSLVAAGTVGLLGSVQGGVTVTVGMTVAAWLGYALGRWGGEPLAARIAGASELSRARDMMRRHGSWVLLVCRGVPVVAEASTLLAGATRLGTWRFGLVTGLGNAAIAGAYAIVGTLRLSGVPALVTPVLLSIAVPALALGAMHLFAKRATP